MAPINVPNPQFNPEDMVNIGRDAALYLAALQKVWPIAVIGWVVAVIMRQKQLLATPGILGKVVFTISEGLVGATGAVLTALLYPALLRSFPELLPAGIEAEIALCGFIGGTFSRWVFRTLARKIFGADSRLNELTKEGPHV